jgi:tetratricopeptide (TPR) repeat protein
MLVLPALFVLGSLVLSASDGSRPREQAMRIVVQIQRADYEGNRSALKRLHAELAPFVSNQKLAAPVLYWQGFALWRRAINGFNDKADSAELREDLQQALNDFDAATRIDPFFADAKVGALSCTGLLAYSVRQQDTSSAPTTDLIARSRALRREIEAEAPENPRFLWVEGPIFWNVPPQYGGGQPKAIETYNKGLESIRNHRSTVTDSLDPTWGEPELLMSLAWSKLNQTAPDTNGAQQDADAALKLVPYWHYVRDILLPQIQEAKRQTTSEKVNSHHL